jgi:hypothetical protein
MQAIRRLFPIAHITLRTSRSGLPPPKSGIRPTPPAGNICAPCSACPAFAKRPTWVS